MSGDETAAPAPSLARIALGIAAGGVLGALLLGGIAWAAYAANLPEQEAAFGPRSLFAALAAASVMGLFTIVFAPAATALLLALGRRSALAFACGGALAGAALMAATGLATGEFGEPVAFVAIGLLGALHLVVARWIGGIRR